MSPEEVAAVERSLADPAVAAEEAALLGGLLRSLERASGTLAGYWLGKVYEAVGKVYLHREGGLAAARQLVLDLAPEVHRKLLSGPEERAAAEGKARAEYRDELRRRRDASKGGRPSWE